MNASKINIKHEENLDSSDDSTINIEHLEKSRLFQSIEVNYLSHNLLVQNSQVLPAVGQKKD